ncbi:hypothetical protein CROQUDRAFT_95073 [Cronartium quercuum f. sp. fusiforme G11]|uniref:Peptide N-acetyl-beta-D-glucosaminyl asparaginase amidase A N-terminal domain-containing protein n=1 Tax=Cronartium quercuum f. sp. fusiforme G11 TaxID=708437 RepID=A0A9P6TA78_9BASI|nr:hypothetical protein CROQUDRAFT_95073 [Cronartium quercuum f. sp. fusiforme G11]
MLWISRRPWASLGSPKTNFAAHPFAHKNYKTAELDTASQWTQLVSACELSGHAVVPIGGKSCVVTLIQNTFGSTYNKPAKTNYSAPTTCGKPGSWAAVILNLTVTSQGTQYDRLSVKKFSSSLQSPL